MVIPLSLPHDVPRDRNSNDLNNGNNFTQNLMQTEGELGVRILLSLIE